MKLRTLQLCRPESVKKGLILIDTEPRFHLCHFWRVYVNSDLHVTFFIVYICTILHVEVRPNCRVLGS